MPYLATGLVVDRVDLVSDGSNSASYIRLLKRKENNAGMDYTEIMVSLKPEVRQVIEAEVAKSKAAADSEILQVKEDLKKAAEQCNEATEKANKLEADLAAATDELAKSKAAVEASEEELMKSATPELQQMFKSIKEKAEAAEAALAKAKEDKETAERLEKAKEMKNLPVATEALADLLKTATPEMHALLKAANSIIGNGLDPSGANSGSGGGEKGSGGATAWDQIEKKAETLATEHKLTKAASIARAVRENPDLYAQYVEETKKGDSN